MYGRDYNVIGNLYLKVLDSHISFNNLMMFKDWVLALSVLLYSDARIDNWIP